MIFNYLSRSIKRERYVGRYHIVDNQWASFNRDLVGNPVKLGKTEPDYGNKIFLRNSPAAKLPLLQGRLRFFFQVLILLIANLFVNRVFLKQGPSPGSSRLILFRKTKQDPTTSNQIVAQRTNGIG